jgi:hypothetical protein
MGFAKVLTRFVSCAALVCSGCTIYIGPYDDSDRNAPGKPSVLPDPSEGPTNEPALDEAQQARKEEAERYVTDVIYQGGTILGTIQLPSGDVVDFIDRGSLPALPYDELPPLPFTPDLALPPGVELGTSELEHIPEAVALAATATPFQRPTFWPYILGETDATSIEDYLNRYQLGGQPSGGQHVHAGLISVQENRGISGFMNQFRPEVEPGSFSLMEFAIGCPAEKPVEIVGVVISVDKVNPFGKNQHALTDGEPRLHVEYARVDPTTGLVQYNWDNLDGSFKPNPLRMRHHPGQKVSVSVPGGAQVEHFIAIFQEPLTHDWWIFYKDELLGYYPASLFTMLNGGACVTEWYGEVARHKPVTPEPWPKTEMGSGQFAEAGPLLAAYVRNPKYHDLSWFGVEPPDTIGFSSSYNKDCYNRSPLVDGMFFLGGSGGKMPECVVE